MATPNPSTFPRLCVMMFLQLVVWGAWYVSMTGFINAQEMSGLTAAAYTVGPIAAVISPLFLGLIADRFFSTQRVLGVMHLLGAGAIALAPSFASPFDAEKSNAFFHPFTLALLVHMLCYMPTLSLTVTLSLHNLANPQKQFPIVRVFGTIGWIAGNLAVSALPGKDVSAAQFYLTAASGVVLGLYSLFALPHTPPPLKGKTVSVGQALGADAVVLLKRPAFAVFMLCSLLLCVPLAGYYQQARNFVADMGFESPTAIMSLGQVAEILFMLLLPICLARLGFKWILAIGMLAWAVRYGLFATAESDRNHAFIVLGVLLHGICYDFFFVTGMLYADLAAPTTIRGQAQGLVVLVTQGIGMLIGAQVMGRLAGEYLKKEPVKGLQTGWYEVWGILALLAFGVLFLFLIAFYDRTPTRPATEEPTPSR